MQVVYFTIVYGRYTTVQKTRHKDNTDSHTRTNTHEYTEQHADRHINCRKKKGTQIGKYIYRHIDSPEWQTGNKVDGQTDT